MSWKRLALTVSLAGSAVAVLPVAVAATTDTTVTPDTTLPPPPPDPGDFTAPVIGADHPVPAELDLCSVLTPVAIDATPFGVVFEPGEPVPMAGNETPGCRYVGINVGEIAYGTGPTATFVPEQYPDGTYELIAGNTSFLTCSDADKEYINCTAFVMLTADTLLNITVNLPSNDLVDLGETTRALATAVVDAIPAA